MTDLFTENFSEYDDPELYDAENNFNDELPLLLDWAQKKKGVVLDLACGTGRTAISLAQKGISIIGVDLHRGMLEKAKEKSTKQNLDIEWVQQDITKLQLDIKSSLIYMVGNSFQHFLSNETQDALFKSVKSHLQQDGIFIFNSRFPSKEELMQPETEEYWRSFIDHIGRSVDVSTIATYDPLSQIQNYITIRRFQEENGKTSEARSTISLRYTYPEEMKRLIQGHGFEITGIYQDWNKTPLTGEAYGMVLVCKKLKDY